MGEKLCRRREERERENANANELEEEMRGGGGGGGWGEEGRHLECKLPCGEAMAGKQRAPPSLSLHQDWRRGHASLSLFGGLLSYCSSPSSHPIPFLAFRPPYPATPSFHLLSTRNPTRSALPPPFSCFVQLDTDVVQLREVLPRVCFKDGSPPKEDIRHLRQTRWRAATGIAKGTPGDRSKREVRRGEVR